MALRIVARPARFFPKSSLSTLSLAEEFPSTPAAGLPAPSGVQTTTLANGMKVVTKETGAASAAAAVSVGAGSRFGAGGEALLLKHMAFKGTTVRSDLKLANDLELAGVDVGASVGRETLLLTASGLRGSMPVALEALAESVLKPKLVGWNVAEIKAETVAADLKVASADAQVLLVEKLHEAAFGVGSPLGRPIFADPSAVDGAALAGHAAGLFKASNMIVACVGVEHAEVVKAAECLFAGAAAGDTEAVETSPFVGGAAQLKADSPLTHVAVAFAGPAAGSKDHAAALVFKQLLGAPSVSVAYADGGLVGVCGASDPASAGELTARLVEALKVEIDDAGVAEAKLALKTAAAVEAEDAGALAAALASGSMAPSVDAVSTADVKAFAAKLLASKPALASVGPAAAVPTYAALTKMF